MLPEEAPVPMANRDQLLVSTDWLAANLDDPNVRIVEVDEDTDA